MVEEKSSTFLLENMIISNFNKLQDFEVYKLWNKEFGNIYPISPQLFERNVANVDERTSFIAKDNNQVIGFILGKTWQEDYYIPNYSDTGWISLIYVVPSRRNQGIGSSLLNATLEMFNKLGKTNIFLGKDYNNFFPGLPVDLKSHLNWFINKGFEHPYDTYDLIRLNNKDLLPIPELKYKFRLATIQDKDELINFVQTNWPGRWTKETIDYFNNGGTGREYVICLDQFTIIGFAKVGYPNTETKLISYSLTWRNRFNALGGIGPLGINEKYRHQHLGTYLVNYATNILINEGVSQIIIDWTGLLDFYRQINYEVWKSYFYVNKKMKGEQNA